MRPCFNNALKYAGWMRMRGLLAMSKQIDYQNIEYSINRNKKYRTPINRSNIAHRYLVIWCLVYLSQLRSSGAVEFAICFEPVVMCKVIISTNNRLICAFYFRYCGNVPICTHCITHVSLSNDSRFI